MLLKSTFLFFVIWNWPFNNYQYTNMIINIEPDWFSWAKSINKTSWQQENFAHVLYFRKNNFFCSIFRCHFCFITFFRVRLGFFFLLLFQFPEFEGFPVIMLKWCCQSCFSITILVLCSKDCRQILGSFLSMSLGRLSLYV